MKKASILSFQFADNYGAILQIYSLSEVIKARNIQVDVIDFSPDELAMPYEVGINLKKYIRNRGIKKTIISSLVKIKNFKKNKIRRKNFEQFKMSYLNITPKKYKVFFDLDQDTKIKEYDYYIVGSDQVWNPDFYKYAKDAYFLNYAAPQSLKISYAASIANELDTFNKKIFLEELKSFDYISVREDSGKEQIKDLTSKNISVVLDPTLLMSKNEWMPLIGERKVHDKYIFVYDLVLSETLTKLVNKLSDSLNVKIICFSNGKTYHNFHSSFNGINPKEFLTLIDGAEIVVSSSFHGVAFSLVLEKQFITVPHPTRGSRMVDLLNNLGLEENIIRSYNDDFTQINNIDYQTVNKKIDKMRTKSLDFLSEAFK